MAGSHAPVLDLVLHARAHLGGAAGEGEVAAWIAASAGVQRAEEVHPDVFEFIENEPGAVAALRERGVLGRAPGAAATTRAWDLGRLVTVARVAHTAGYLDEASAWQWVDAAAAATVECVGSWQDFGISYVLGRSIWGGADDGGFEPTVDEYRALTSDPDSPWLRGGWWAAAS